MIQPMIHSTLPSPVEVPLPGSSAVAFAKAERTPRAKLAEEEIKIVEIEETVWKFLRP